jgi:hypothetical protein
MSTELEASWAYAHITGIFISCFANILKPLNRLMEEKQAFQWTPEVEATLQTLKKTLYCPCSCFPAAKREVHC